MGTQGRSRKDRRPTDRDPAAVRPYALTGGRTRPGQLDFDLAIETLVSTTAQGEAGWPYLTPEGRKIVELCRDLVWSPRSPPAWRSLSASPRS
jgi:hypothetical protein